MTWTGAPGDVRADTIVLRNGEVIEGSIIDATRNTVVVQRAIGGMHQMPMREIEEVRVDLAQGQRISGQLLSWADGVYQMRSGGQVIRISDGAILSRETGEEAAGQSPRSGPPQSAGQQTVRMAAAPATSAPEETAAARAAAAREQMAVQQPARKDESPAPATGEQQSLVAGEEQSPGAGEEQSAAAGAQQSLAAVGENQSPPSGEKQSPAVMADPSPGAGAERSPAVGEKGSPAAGEQQSSAVGEKRRPATGAEQSLAAVDKDHSPATGEKGSLTVRASVDPAEPGADDIVFKIELSRPAEQTVLLIYGTVEGTAKAGEDFEPQQGVVTLAPGTESAEVRVPLIEHSPSKGEKRFELFLTADPKVAEVVDRRIVATIDGGD